MGGWRLIFVSVQIAPGAAHNAGSVARVADGGKRKIAGPSGADLIDADALKPGF